MVNPTALLPLTLLPAQERPQQNNCDKSTVAIPLWMAVVFPKLALDIFSVDANQTAVVSWKDKDRYFVFVASLAAEHAGVVSGMTLSAAYTLCPKLVVFERDIIGESSHLQKLATWAAKWTSKVVIQPSALLLEVQGSAKLFGGLPVLKNSVVKELYDNWQYLTACAITASPSASIFLAKTGISTIVSHKEDLRSILGQYPLSAIPFEHKLKKQLHNIGIRVLRDLWRLPKEDLSRRFGKKLVHYVDCLLGESREAFSFYQAPSVFASKAELPMPIENTAYLLPTVNGLLNKLMVFLREHDFCINECRYIFSHYQKTPTTLIIRLNKPSRESQHIALLLDEKLNAIKFPEPVVAIELCVERFYAFTTESYSLFTTLGASDNASPGIDDTPQLIDKLQARLGYTAITSVRLLADHRPEHGYRYTISNTGVMSVNMNPRPLWLLTAPQPLVLQDKQLWLNANSHNEKITLVNGPERIESGWWTKENIARDYYIAINKQGGKLWIFHNLERNQNRNKTWFLHGFFS